MIVTLLGLAAAPVKAQDDAGRSAQVGAADAVHARVLDVEAMSWAWRIEKGNSLSYAKLQKISANWGRGEAVRGQLLAKVKEIVNNRQVRRLTVKEEAELDAAKAEVRALLSGDRSVSEKSAVSRISRQGAIDKAARDILEVEAKHWAWRIAVVRNITFNELKAGSDGWMRGAEISEELLEKVKVRLQSEDIAPLNKTEQARLDAGMKKIKALVSNA
jgi:hypothetical protein